MCNDRIQEKGRMGRAASIDAGGSRVRSDAWVEDGAVVEDVGSDVDDGNGGKKGSIDDDDDDDFFAVSFYTLSFVYF